MIIDKIQVKNFRCIEDEVLNCENLVVLVGSNGAGKSTFLRAIELFFKDSISLKSDDFYNYDTSKEMIVSVTFSNLSSEAEKLFEKYIQGNTLTVERVFKYNDSSVTWKYHGSLMRCSDFQLIRKNLNESAIILKEEYNKVKERALFDSLPIWKNKKEVETNLTKWEELNPLECSRGRDDGQFFGFKHVGGGYLGKYIKPIFIPAVKDATTDATDGPKSPVTEILNLVIRSALSKKPEITKFKKEVLEQHKIIMNPDNIKGLPDLATDMSEILDNFVNDSKIELDWRELNEMNLPLPVADIKLVEDGFKSDVSKVGHGLQRLFILTLLQYLVKAKVISEKDGEIDLNIQTPNILLIIEEPEIYQHPSRQRHLAEVLLKLVNGDIPGVAKNTQIIYCTHSPFFVGIDRIDQIKLLKKISKTAGSPKVTKIIEYSLDKVAADLWEIDGKVGSKYTKSSLLPRLKTLMTPWTNEGFFADAVVLVEGEDDRAALLGVAKYKNINLEGDGFSIIPSGGKNNLDRLYLIFTGFGIPTYVIWDSDYGVVDSKKEDNIRLQKMMKYKDGRIKDWPEGVFNSHACFKKNLNETLKQEVGEVNFAKLLEKYKIQYSYLKNKHALKSPCVIEAIIKDTYVEGGNCHVFEKLIKKIIKIK